MGLHIDLEMIFVDNKKKEGPGIMRKAGFLINTGDNAKKADVKKLREKNKKMYGLSHKFVSHLSLPRAKTKEWLKVLTINQILKVKSNFSTSEKIHFLVILRKALEKKLVTLERLRTFNSVHKPCHIAIGIKRVTDGPSITYEYEGQSEIKEKAVPVVSRDQKLSNLLNSERYNRNKHIQDKAGSNDDDDEDSESEKDEEDDLCLSAPRSNSGSMATD
jgi:hypothetical protein